MLFVSWIAIGLAVGLIAAAISVGIGRLEDGIVAVVGSVAGGWIYVSLSALEILDVTLETALAGFAGAALLLALARVLASRQEAI